jgi:hypothetical protein
MKKFKKLYNNLTEMHDYPPGWSDGSDKRRVDGDSFGGFRVGEGNTISRINAFINKYLSGSYLAGDYKYALRELRVRINHIGLDFNSEPELMVGENRIPVKLHGSAFGTTPTTDLMKGFNKGEDLPSLALIINYGHDPNTEMCYMNGRITLDESTNESERLDEFAPLLAAVPQILAALPTITRVASTVGTVASAAGAVKDLVSPKKPTEVGEDGMSPRQKRINNAKRILKKK